MNDEERFLKSLEGKQGGFTPREPTKESFDQWLEDNEDRIVADNLAQEREMIAALDHELNGKTDAEVMAWCRELEADCPEFARFQNHYFDPKERLRAFSRKVWEANSHRLF